MRTGSSYFRRILSLILMTLCFQYASAVVRYVKPVASGTGTGLTWANAAADLQLMINNSSSGDEIWVVQGTYYPLRKANATGTVTLNNRDNAFVLKAGVSIYGGFVGTELARNLRNYTTHVTLLSGDIGAVVTITDNACHVVIAAGSAGNGTLDGFTVLNGYADFATSPITVNSQTISSFTGAGIYIAGSSPTIRNCIIRRNNALNGVSIGGAGINITASSAPAISNCTISSNITTGTSPHGAGMYIAASSATLTSCTFSNNTSSAEAGAIYIGTTATPVLNSCTFTSNSAVTNGGAIANHASTAPVITGGDFTTNTAQLKGGAIYNTAAALTLSACDFSGNTASNTLSTGAFGAGIYSSASTLVVAGCHFLQNDAESEGGGIYNTSCSITITNSSFSQNTGGQGGAGIGNQSTTGSITSCDFSSNSTSGLGGGIHNISSSPATSNCLFSGNSATLGGGMHNGTNSSPSITSCRFLGNTCSDQGAGLRNVINCSPQVTNCIFSGNKAGQAGGGTASQDGSNALFTNCTFSGNSSNIGMGSAMFNSINTAVIVKNCIAWHNFNTQISNDASTTTTVSNSIVEGIYPGGINADPLFVSPVSATLAPSTAGDYHVQKCSPALNGGNNAAIPSGVVTDLDNNNRIILARVDMGAYEKQLIFATPDAAGIIYVDATKSGDGSSWLNATPELADALMAAKYNSAVSQIWVAEGTYYPKYNAGDGASFACSNTDRENSFVLVNNVKVFGGFIGTETLLGQRDWATNTTILSADIGTLNNNSDNCYHVMIGAGPVGTATLDGFTVVNGNANGPGITPVNGLGPSQSNGSALHLYSSSPIINNCKFSNNVASNVGGGLHLNSGSAAVISNCIISGNSAISSGAGIYLGASSAIITNCTISGNKAGSGGAGIAIDAGTPIIKNTIIWGNKLTNGFLSSIFITASTPIISFCDIEGGYPGNLNIDPLFVNPQFASAAPTTAGDYRLKSCSPVIDAGNNAGVNTKDLDGNTRIINVNVDMGAYEKQYAVADATGTVYVDATKNGDGKTWATAVPELADAIKAAKYNGSITQVWVAKGTYYPLYDAATFGCSPADNRDKSFVQLNNLKLYGGFAGGETTIAGRNFITNETILSADIGIANDNTDNCYHVAVSAGTVGAALIDGFTITKGNANGNGFITVNGNVSDRVRGAGITNLSSSPAIRNCVFFANAGGAGGAIGNLTAAPSIDSCTFLSNTATGSGGVLDNYLGSAASMNNCLFSGNTAGLGGAVMNSGGSSLTIKNSIFSGNTATDGGAFYNHASTTATITNCLFNGNKAANGAGLYFRSSSAAIINCTVTANLGSMSGGGIFNDNANPDIRNSIIWGNNAVSNNNISILSGIPSIQNSIIEGGYAGGTNIINAAPLFVAPQPATASPTNLGNYHLQPCSPAINYGDNSFVTAITDIDGNTRIKFTDVDLGAYEVQTQDLTQSTWRGINTNWNDRINWCGGYIPLATTNVTIPSGLTNYPTTALTNAVKNITLANNTAVTISSTGSLSINGTYNNTGSTITNNGSWIMTGSSTSQSFPGATATIAAMNNLEINNPSGITFNKSFSITGSLIPTAGNINVNNVDITLKSTATATASVAIIQPAASITHTGTGSFIVERFINTGTNTAIGQHAKSWQFLATPVSGQTIFQSWQESGTVPPGFGTWISGTGTGFDVITALPSIKFYNDNNNTWTAVSNTGTALQNKNGYMLYVRGDRTVTSYLTAANNTIMRSKGTIYTTSNLPPPVIVQANKFQAIGNPYPARIGFAKLRTASTGINDVFYVWDPKVPGNSQSGAYQVLSGLTAYAPTIGDPATNYPAGVPSPYIESGQAFFVRGNVAGGNVNFNENIKEIGNRMVTRVDNNNTVQRQFLYASLYSNGMIADGNIIAFDHGFGNEVNELDAEKITNSGENFGLNRHDTILAVEAHDLININDTIVYHFQNLRQQSYQLRFAPINMADVNLPAFLIDRFTGSINTISLHDSSFIDFTVTADTASDAADRFIIVFRLNGPVPLTFIKLKAYRNEKNINVSWQVENETGVQFYEVEKSLTGDNFFSMATVTARNSNNQGTKNYLSIDTDPSTAVNFYRIKSINTDNEINYSNIVKVLSIQATPSISVYPNPVLDGNLKCWFTCMPAGTYTVTLFNTLGQLIFKKQLEYDGFSNSTNVKLDHLIPHGTYHVEIYGPEKIKFTMIIEN